MRILCVGAGFAGAVIARELAEAGHQIDVIDSRDHIAGNAYDYTDEHGIRIHKYGPHIWHTNNEEAQEWFSRFTEWVPYQHKVQAKLANGEYAPLPINRESINKALGKNFTTNEEAEAFLEKEREAFEEGTITNSRQLIHSTVGRKLCNIFFAPYTKKMWGLELQELSASVAARIPTKLSDEGLYFPNDKFQGMPLNGYTAAFRKIFDHPNIKVTLNKPFDPQMEVNYDHIFNSMPIDVYFGQRFGHLPYRSLKFTTVTIPSETDFPTPTVNFTTTDKWTRVTDWKKYAAHGECKGFSTLTFEEPCDYKDNNEERYYPVKDAGNRFRSIYNEYRDFAEKTKKNMTFIGRCGQYVYIDMNQAISNSLSIVRKFLKSHEQAENPT